MKHRNVGFDAILFVYILANYRYLTSKTVREVVAKTKIDTRAKVRFIIVKTEFIVVHGVAGSTAVAPAVVGATVLVSSVLANCSVVAGTADALVAVV